MTVLGIDTSCYTTSGAISSGGEIIRFARKLLPVGHGKRGLRQSEAVFQHIKQIPEVVSDLFSVPVAVDAVCVSSRPRDGEESYMPVFETGYSFACALASSMRIPLITTTHQRGHLRAALIGSGLTRKDYLAVHLSGGTTDVLAVREEQIELLGTSLDLHAGQLVDRIGVRMGLPFPCGSELEKLAVLAENRQALIPVSATDGNCHLSGAEASLHRMLDAGMPFPETAFQLYSLLARTVLRMLETAGANTGLRDALIMGGVASSALLRALIHDRINKRRIPMSVFFGNPAYSTDNAAGVALIGEEKLQLAKEE